MIYLLLSLLTIIIIWLIICYINQHRLPKQYAPSKFQPSKLNDPPNKDRYLASKVNGQKFDTIVIGSGLSGLTAASVLSRCGKRCLVLEQHDTAGGWTAAFQRGGYEFDTGVHFVGNYKMDMYNWLGKTPFEWSQIIADDNQPKKLILTEKGLKGFQQMVDKYFPADKQAFEKYLSEMPLAIDFDRKSKMIIIFNQIPLIGGLLIKFCLRKFKGKQNIILQDKLDELKISPKLQEMLKQPLILLGIKSNETTYYHTLMMFNYQCQEAFYPKNGTSDFALKAIPVIYEVGGKVLVGKKVKKILLNEQNTKAIGVQMDDRDETIIKANNVIGACNYFSLVENCLPSAFAENYEYKYLKEHTSLSPASFFVFIGLECTQQELQIPSLTIFNQQNSTYFGESINDLKTANCRAFASFHKNSGVLVCFHKNDLFDQWKHLPTTKRGQEYEDLKKSIGEAMIERHLYSNFPQLRGKIGYMEAGTSLTTEHYLAAQNGSAYGIKVNIEKSQLRIQKYLVFEANKVKGLWFIGQDIIGAGLFPVMISGIIVSSFILGYYSLMDLITGRSLFKDFPNLLKYLQKEEEKEKKKQ